MHIRVAALLTAAGLLLTLHPSGDASAAWSVSADGTSAAAADTLAAPTSVTVTWNPVVHVSWTASASPWATGYRVLRAVAPAGPWTQIADVAAPTTTVDDTPGAGTYYYAVQAYKEGWSSTVSDVAARSDATYVFRSTSGFTGTTCPASAGRYDMEQGYVPTGAGGGAPVSDLSFCTDTFRTGQFLPAGQTTVTAYAANSNNKNCTMTLILLQNGATLLGYGTGTVPAGKTTAAPLTWTFSTSSVAFATGDRLMLQVSAQGNSGTNNCSDTRVWDDGAAVPSRVTLPE
jgi:hypothetical protein